MSFPFLSEPFSALILEFPFVIGAMFYFIEADNANSEAMCMNLLAENCLTMESIKRAVTSNSQTGEISQRLAKLVASFNYAQVKSNCYRSGYYSC